jgi:VCBS repeat protein/Big-like domain-containing protein
VHFRSILFFLLILFLSVLPCLAQQPCGIATVGDLNGDGKPDLVVANGTLNNIGLFLNTGAGSFGPGTFLGLSGAAFSVCLADFNSDGHLDILVLGGTIDTGGIVTPSLQILFGDGKGGFSAPVKLSTPDLVFFLTFGGTPAVADFNGDGILDIAYPSQGKDPVGPGAAVSIVFGNGKGNFSAPSNIEVQFDLTFTSTAAITTLLRVIDFNKDTKPDLFIDVVPLRGIFSQSFIALGDGKGGFSKIVPLIAVFPPGNGNSPTASPERLSALGIADFNGDGNLDFLVNALSTPAVVYGDGQGGFLFTDFTVPLDPNAAINPEFMLDVDGDQTVDLLARDGYMPGNGHGGFGDKITVAFPAGDLIAVADLDGDGKPDFVFRQNGSTDISVFLNNVVAPGTISASTSINVFRASASTTSVGGQVMLMAKVVSAGGAPTGSVTFTDGATTLGSAPVNSYQMGALQTSFSAGGLHNITATFTGGTEATTHTSFGNSSAGPIQVSVNNTAPTAPPPSVSIKIVPNPARDKDLVEMTSTVTSSSGTPTGSVLFIADGQVTDAFTVISGGGSFPAGLHNVQGVYGGDGIFPPATSPTLVEDVRPLNAVRSPSSTQINVAPSSNGFSVSVNVSGGSNQPSSVANLWIDGAVLLAEAPGSAPFSVTAPPGTYTVTAEYIGDAVLAPSSSSVKVIVGPPPAPDYTVSASPQSATITAGQTAMFTLTVTPSGGFSSSVTFGCAGLPAGANCSFSPSSVTPNGTPVSVSLAISTTAPHTAGVFKPGSQPRLYAIGATLAFGLMLLDGRRRRKKLAMVAVLSVVALLASCGGGGPSTTPPNMIPTTPKGTTTITVTAASSSNHSVPITLTVN